MGLSLLWGVLFLRATQLQFLPNDRLESLRSRQFRTVVTLPARRGAILDRENRELALSAKTYSVYADPKIIDSPKWASKVLAKELGHYAPTLYSRIKDKGRRFVWIERMIDEGRAQRIKALDIRGVSVIQEWKRVYPNETILAHTLGLLGIEGQALEGLELQYDLQMRGNEKKVNVRRDARGRPLIADGLLFQQNADGNDLKLTIDSEIQYMLESELVAAVSNFEASSAIGIVMDAQTSAIRAMATVPTFDANKASRLRSELRRNRSIADTFEPGSTMKTFVVAAALKEKKLHANSRYFCENGFFKVGDRIIREADSQHRFGWLTASEILAHSSNIGTTKIAFQIGEDALRQTLLDFGFGSKLGIDLPGEAKGTVLPLPWRNHLLANISFGHGVAASALQIANAYAAVANGGKLNTPYIVESIRDPETGRETRTEPKTIRQVLTPEESAQMRLMLSGVTTEGGTGTNARVNGFIVAGKTGTAQKANPKGRGYLAGAYISSFAGFIPANDPRFVIYVAVDHPKKAYYGAQVAAPIFSQIASYAARKEGLAPMLLSEKNLVKKISRKPAVVAADPGPSVSTEITQSKEPVAAEVMPDLAKLTVREVLKKVSGKDIKIKWIGSGVVSETFPETGAQIPESREVRVLLK